MDDIKILYEDDDIAALDKSAGIIVHPDGKNIFTSVTDFLMKTFPAIAEVGEPMVLSSGEKIMRPGIVHRIDKETSGVLLVAKTAAGYIHLKEQFQNREIKKTYYAFVYGALKEERGVIDTPIGKGGLGKRLASAFAKGELREAVTKFKTIKNTPEATFLEVWPLTGRTHQIRVHLKSIHHAIVCDPLYASHGAHLLGFKRLALHAGKIVFKDMKGKEVTIEAPFPEDFKKAVAAFGLKETDLRK